MLRPLAGWLNFGHKHTDTQTDKHKVILQTPHYGRCSVIGILDHYNLFSAKCYPAKKINFQGQFF